MFYICIIHIQINYYMKNLAQHITESFVNESFVDKKVSKLKTNLEKTKYLQQEISKAENVIYTVQPRIPMSRERCETEDAKKAWDMLKFYYDEYNKTVDIDWEQNDVKFRQNPGKKYPILG